MARKIVDAQESVDNPHKEPLTFDANGLIRIPQRFAALNRVIMRDLNGSGRSPTFYKYTKDQIATYLTNPYSYQKNLRNAAIYMYAASSHFRRLIQYFVALSDLSYIVSPYRIDTSTAKAATIGKQYRRTLNILSAMDIKNQFPKILTVCLREDTFFGTMWVTNDNVTIQQLPSDYCEIAVIEGNVLNVSFDFSYFDSNSEFLELYPPEFNKKYNLYQNDRTGMKWQELDSPTSFAVKCNNDILNYSVPPFAGIFRDIYDLEDYRNLKMTKTELENYALLVMRLGINKDGEWEMDFDKAREFYSNLDGVLPEEVGAVLSPMDIDKISFEKSNTGDTDTIADAEQNLFTSAGVSTLLFNNDKASSNALLLSIKADQALTYGIVKSIECVVNRFIQSYSYGKNFKVTFLDVSPYNRREIGEQYLKGAQYGLPMLSHYCVSQGLSQADMDCMDFLENDVLDLKSRFKPLQSSSTISSEQSESSGNGSDGAGDAGRPKKEVGDLTDSGESSQEHDDGDDSMNG